MYGKGISREGSLLDMAVDLEIVKKSGAWFTYEGEQLGQGRENAKMFLTEQPRDHGRDQRPGAHQGRPEGWRGAGRRGRRRPTSSAPRTTSRSTSPEAARQLGLT